MEHFKITITENSAKVEEGSLSIIDFMNHDVSMENVLTPTEKIQEILAKYNAKEKI